jgi:hypothetical protein
VYIVTCEREIHSAWSTREKAEAAIEAFLAATRNESERRWLDDHLTIEEGEVDPE